MTGITNRNQALADGSNLNPVYPADVRWNIDIPRDSTPLALIERAIEKYPDNVAMSFEGKKITYREFGDLISRAAQGLKTQGVAEGTKVGLFMPNTPYYPVMFYAALKAGATVVNYSLASKDKSKLLDQIRDSDTAMMVTMDLKDFYNPVSELLKEGHIKGIVRCELGDMLPFPKNVLYTAFKKKSMTTPQGVNPAVVSFRNLTDNNGMMFAPDVDPQSVAVLQYTSGTSGIPKGAMLTHFNLAANALQMEEFFKAPSRKPGETLLEPGKERAMAAIPLSHIFGETVLMVAYLMKGGHLILQADPRNTKQTLDLLTKNKATAYPAAPRLLQLINEYPDRRKYDLSGLKTVIAGSEALPPGTRAAFRELEISEGYGQTEASPVVSCNMHGGLNRPGSIGLPLPRTEVKIVSVDDESTVMAIGQDGEIWVRGPQVMKGYYNRPDETARTITPDGWLRTGDVGHLDADMFLHITDRLGRMYKRNGFQVSPVQVEKKLSLHPAVAECVVITLPNGQGGYNGKALVRLKDGVDSTPSADDIKSFLKKDQHLGSHELPDVVEFITEPLLRTAVNKIDWKKIQDTERAQMVVTTPPSAPKPSL